MWWKKVLSVAADVVASLWFKIASLIVADVVASLTYTWLADGGLWHFGFTIIVLPLAAFSLILFWTVGMGEPISPADDYPWMGFQEGEMPRFNPLFWYSALYFLLPVVLRGASLGLDRLGYPEAADVLFGLRYWSLLIIFGVVLLRIFFAVAFPRKRGDQHLAHAT